MAVARELPPEEAVPTLREWCTSCEVGHGANYYQAIAHTGAPEAHAVLRHCFTRIWNTDGLMAPVEFCNWVAFDAICCLAELLQLGEDSEEFRGAYDALTAHPCPTAREDARRWLLRYFDPEEAARESSLRTAFG